MGTETIRKENWLQIVFKEKDKKDIVIAETMQRLCRSCCEGCVVKRVG